MNLLIQKKVAAKVIYYHGRKEKFLFYFKINATIKYIHLSIMINR